MGEYAGCRPLLGFLLQHSCPTLWLIWSALSEEQLSWATYTTLYIVNVKK